MPYLSNSRNINEFYESYKNIEISFTKNIYESLKLVHNQISLKTKEGHKSCILYSSSCSGAKVILSMSNDMVRYLRRHKTVSLRYSFYKDFSKNDFFSFFVSCSITDITQYENKTGFYFVQLVFTQRPPDDLILILGSLLDAKKNSSKRREERIILDPEALRHLELTTNRITIVIDGIPRNCILRDLSFGGVKAIILGNPKYLIDKEAVVNLTLTNKSPISVKGRVLRHEPVVGRRDLVAIVVQFSEENLSLEYNMMINEYLTSFGKKSN